MPRRRSSVRKTREDKRRHLDNLKVKNELKKMIKQFLALVSAKKIDDAKSFIHKVYSKLDKAAKKKVIHPTVANRRKSRFARKLTKTT